MNRAELGAGSVIRVSLTDALSILHKFADDERGGFIDADDLCVVMDLLGEAHYCTTFVAERGGQCGGLARQALSPLILGALALVRGFADPDEYSQEQGRAAVALVESAVAALATPMDEWLVKPLEVAP